VGQIWDVYSEQRGTWIRGTVVLIEFGVVTVDFDRPLEFGHYEIGLMQSTPDRFRLVQ